MIATAGALLLAGCASQRSVLPQPAPCEVATASPWIESWFEAWELVSLRILRLADAPPPDVLFYDNSCVYTTSPVSSGGAPAVDGPMLRGSKMSWRAVPHSGSLTLPDSSSVPVQLMSFADVDRGTGPFFVMAAPSYWAQMGHGDQSGITAVFLHEFAHTRHIPRIANVIEPIDAAWPYAEELDDDAVQKQFGSDPAYVAAYTAERDLLYRAADAESIDEARALAAGALEMMRNRHARWFTGDKAVFAKLDNVFLALEGAGQWTGYAWLSHPEGGGLDRDAAIKTMLGRRRWWSQDEGLALFLAVDRLLPDWPLLVFGSPSMGAVDLLARAVEHRDEA